MREGFEQQDERVGSEAGAWEGARRPIELDGMERWYQGYQLVDSRPFSAEERARLEGEAWRALGGLIKLLAWAILGLAGVVGVIFASNALRDPWASLLGIVAIVAYFVGFHFSGKAYRAKCKFRRDLEAGAVDVYWIHPRLLPQPSETGDDPEHAYPAPVFAGCERLEVLRSSGRVVGIDGSTPDEEQVIEPVELGIPGPAGLRDAKRAFSAGERRELIRLASQRLWGEALAMLFFLLISVGAAWSAFSKGIGVVDLLKAGFFLCIGLAAAYAVVQTSRQKRSALRALIKGFVERSVEDDRSVERLPDGKVWTEDGMPALWRQGVTLEG